MYPCLIQGEWVSSLSYWTPRWVVEHRTNEKRTPIMASSSKKSKRYLSDSDSETERDFTRFTRSTVTFFDRASDGNEGVLCIPQSSSSTETSPSDCVVSYSGHLLGVRVLFLCREAVGVFYSPSRQGKPKAKKIIGENLYHKKSGVQNQRTNIVYLNS